MVFSLQSNNMIVWYLMFLYNKLLQSPQQFHRIHPEKILGGQSAAADHKRDFRVEFFGELLQTGVDCAAVALDLDGGNWVFLFDYKIDFGIVFTPIKNFVTLFKCVAQNVRTHRRFKNVPPFVGMVNYLGESIIEIDIFQGIVIDLKFWDACLALLQIHRKFFQSCQQTAVVEQDDVIG